MPKAVPLGEGGIAVGDDGRGIPAAAVHLYDPSGEKVFQKRPQAFLEHKYKNQIPLIMRRAEAERIPNRQIVPPPGGCGQKNSPA